MLNTSNTLTKSEIKNADHNLALPELSIPDDLQALNMPEMSQLANLLGGMENLKIWLNTPHPVLGATPISYHQEGKLQEVLTYFIYAIETGQPS